MASNANNLSRGHWRFAIVTLLAYLLVTGIVLFKHEPWRDEAQAWLIARDVSFFHIFRQVSYEGTAALWHVMLVPLAKSGLPYVSAFILHLALAAAAVMILLLYAPFSRMTKVLFAFSYYMAYEYAIIARNYNLTILLLFALAALHAKRFQRPMLYAGLVFLLFNTNLHSGFVAVAILLLFAWEFFQRPVRPAGGYAAMVIMVLGGVAAFLQLRPAPDAVQTRWFEQFNFWAPPFILSNAFFARFPGNNAVAALFVLAAALIALSRKPAPFFVILFSYTGLFYTLLFQRYGSERHHGLVLIFLVFALWLADHYEQTDWFKLKNALLAKLADSGLLTGTCMVVLNVCLAASVISALGAWGAEYFVMFSGAKDMANHIKKNHLEDRTIVAHFSSAGAALLPFLPGKKFWYPDVEAFGTYITWNKQQNETGRMSDPEAIARARRAFPNDRTMLLLLSRPLKDPQQYGFALMYNTSPEVIRDRGEETFYLYRRTD